MLDRVGQAIAADPAFEGVFNEPPGYTATTALSAAGATLLMSGRIQPEHRANVEAELRRRVAAGLAEDGIVPMRPTQGVAPVA